MAQSPYQMARLQSWQSFSHKPMMWKNCACYRTEAISNGIVAFADPGTPYAQRAQE